MSTPTYRVRDWDRHFETSESRKRKHALAWVGMPCKHDGRGFNRLKRHPDWPSLYGTWALILQIAAKCPVRGVLADADGPFTALDIADKVGLPEDLVQRCFDLLTNQQAGINWLEITADSGTQQQTPADSGKDHPYQTRPDQTEPDIQIPEEKSGSGSKRKTSKPKAKKASSVFAWITNEDIRDIGKLISWHGRASACPRPVVGKTDQDLLNVVAVAVRSWENSDDPVKLFGWIIGKKRWDFVTQEHEDTAHKLLKEYRREQNGDIGAMFGQLVESTKMDLVTVPEDDQDEFAEGGEE